MSLIHIMRKILIFFTLVSMIIFTPLVFATGGNISTIFEEISAPWDRVKERFEEAKTREEYKAAKQNLTEPLTEDEEDELYRWSYGGGLTNSNLRADKLDDNAVALKKILKRFHPYQKKLYRTSETSAFQDGLITEGDIVLDKGFMATSSSPEFVKNFRSRDTFFVIEPKLSAYPVVVNPVQNEVLFTPQTTFKVKNIQTFNGKTYVHLEETDTLGWRGIKNIHTGEQYLDTQCSSF
ncbi:hypothetical protein BMR02_15645 [Methylococcaceae bacterium HT1]|nr:hypothetical protein BMR02_15645 [Methylococcaceae bacterium HT1]TXL18910.1 hypothetical protein BMR03_15645 [Methylococcaceae bacterium HT2]